MTSRSDRVSTVSQWGAKHKEDGMRKSIWIVMAFVVIGLVFSANVGSAGDNIVKIKQGCGEILRVINNTAAVRLDDTGKIRVFKDISPDIRFIVNGKEGSVHDLSRGMHACAYRYEQVPEPEVLLIEETGVTTLIDTPDEFDKPAPAPVAKPEPAPVAAPAVLPHTAGNLPLTALLGLMLLALSAGIAIIRRF